MTREAEPFSPAEADQSISQEDVVEWFDHIAEKASLVQKETLRNILQINRETEYLSYYLNDNIRLEELELEELEALYRSTLPLTTHEDFEPHLLRIINGDTSPILTRDSITAMSLRYFNLLPFSGFILLLPRSPRSRNPLGCSSGTTDGRPKYIPFTSFSAQSSLQISELGAAFRARVFPTKQGGRILEFIYGSPRCHTSGGIALGTATTHYYSSEEFKIKQKKTKSFTCSPRDVILLGNYKQTTYCHLLLGLFLCDSVEFVASTFAYSIVQAFASLEELWPEICSNIKTGAISEERVSCPKARRAVLDLLNPNPGLAQRIEYTCEKLRRRDWEGLVPSLWPSAKYIYSIMTGSMLPYQKKLRHYAGNLPLVGADYGSSECWIGANLEPENPPAKVVFSLIPSFAYFEFIPLKRRREGGRVDFRVSEEYEEEEPVPLSRVDVGEEYELVLTTFTGLYRYRLGDVVEVKGFYKGTPQLSFIRRRNVILAVNTDKSTEKDLQLAVEKASLLLPLKRAELVDFTSFARAGDGARRPGNYVVYWEIQGEIDEPIFQECCRVMDLAFEDYGYVVSRRSGTVGPLELRVVKVGTFELILCQYIKNGGTVNQFKTPRCISNKEFLRILHRNTTHKFRSTAYAA